MHRAARGRVEGGSRNEANWRSSLAHAAPLANRAVDAIASDDVVGIVTELLRAGKAPTARSVRQRIRLVFDWCIAQGHRTDNPANDAIDALLPSSGHKTKHRESVAVADVAQVVAKIETTAHASRLGAGMALRFLVLTRHAHFGSDRARWSEIDLDHATWIIPAARMKGGEAHRVPLAEAAVAVLAKARARWGSTGLCSAPHAARRLTRRPCAGSCATPAPRRRSTGSGAPSSLVHGDRRIARACRTEPRAYVHGGRGSLLRANGSARASPSDHGAMVAGFVTGTEAPKVAGVRGAV